MLSHMKCIDVIAKEVHYHNICRTRYQTKAETLTKTPEMDAKTQWHGARELHSKAFKVVCRFVDERILKNEEVSFLVNELVQFCFGRNRRD